MPCRFDVYVGFGFSKTLRSMKKYYTVTRRRSWDRDKLVTETNRIADNWRAARVNGVRHKRNRRDCRHPTVLEIRQRSLFPKIVHCSLQSSVEESHGLRTRISCERKSSTRGRERVKTDFNIQYHVWLLICRKYVEKKRLFNDRCSSRIFYATILKCLTSSIVEFSFQLDILEPWTLLVWETFKLKISKKLRMYFLKFVLILYRD